MHKNIYPVIIILSFVFTSCCKEASDKISENDPQKPVLIGQDIQVNKSLVQLKITGVFSNTDGSYILRARVIDIKENDAYPNLAVIGEEYTITPAFELNERKEMVKNSERNKRLLSIPKQTEVFKAEIYFEKVKGWFIRDIISE